MMHGRGKSDSAIVAAKPANNAERSAAEPAGRGRALADVGSLVCPRRVRHRIAD
jgi:hypothetical protein